ncbi:hydroxyacylglutathione hydrolase [Uruburuella testudinis]|uniref:Hydroxyacylglutathione hydrolase n=1 Tax=Uruburuella testudinis TaxID=1282863 RepID=A0ABY4E1U0_9NEIS|nr:hydroxyacylglutathione hydrolase [Uruburuella testudinis]UOO82926.1 hydroxyacylglutathione hydrolase [Uruburuella testudinis]
MPKITPIAAFNDNYIWLIEANGRAVCVDPGDAEPVSAYLHQHNLQLAQIWITHHHHDHTGGLAALKAAYPDCIVYGNSDIAGATVAAGEGVQIEFAGMHAGVWHTPGHTDQHISYLLHTSSGLHVFCGDTLFSAGCGRVFTGTVEQLFASLQRYNSLPQDTLFYPAHEYTAANLRFAAHIEPDNTDIQTALAQAAHTPTLPVTLAHERRINPFLRTAEAAVYRRVGGLTGRQPADETAVFADLRMLKNHF